MLRSTSRRMNATDIIVVKSPSQPTYDDIDRLVANAGCSKCPHCGESRKRWRKESGKYICAQNGVDAGIVQTEWVPGRLFSRGKLYIPGHFEHRTVWHCETCGAEWLSRPYILSGNPKKHYFTFDVEKVLDIISTSVERIETALGEPLPWLKDI